MDWFDDIQIEEFSTQDFADKAYPEMFEENEDEDSQFFNFLNSKYDL